MPKIQITMDKPQPKADGRGSLSGTVMSNAMTLRKKGKKKSIFESGDKIPYSTVDHAKKAKERRIVK